ncbi:MAG: head GIN domain-containing protein [Cyclobacteriaceae bacterium]
MKKSLVVTLLGILAAGMTFAQSEETRNLSSFSEVSAQEGIDVYLKKGNKEEARVVARSVDLEDVLTEVSGGRLKIHLDGSRWRNVDVDVYVTYKSIDEINASSSGSITAEDPIEVDGDFEVGVSSSGDVRATIKADELSIEASSSGDAVLNVEVDEIRAEVSSSGDVELEGTARIQDIEVSSSGDYDASDVDSEEAEASASSGGSIKVKVSGKIDARASSGGSVRYGGNPKYVDVSSSSGGSVKRSY